MPGFQDDVGLLRPAQVRAPLADLNSAYRNSFLLHTEIMHGTVCSVIEIMHGTACLDLSSLFVNTVNLYVA